MQIKYKPSYIQPLDGFKGVLQKLLLSVSIYGYIIQVYDYGQGIDAKHAVRDTLYYKLKMSASLSQTHWYPSLPELFMVGYKGRVIRGVMLEWDGVEASFKL